jgi:hypothetical protein
LFVQDLALPRKDAEARHIIQAIGSSSLRKEKALDAIAAGKNVLCEKAFTPDARDAEEVIMAAKAKSGSLTEAMWTQFTADARYYAKCSMRGKSLVMCSAPCVILALIWILRLYHRSTGITTLLLGLEVCSILGSTP